MGKLVVFIGCVKTKEDHRCEAQDLYISPLFEKSFAYAKQLTSNGGSIYILSAKYHLLPIDKVVSPYDLTLNEMSADEKREWSDKVISMCEKSNIKQDDHIVFLCGENYMHYLKEYFTNYECPLDGLALGESMHWLDENTKDEFKEKFSIITMSLINRLKLAKMLLKFGSIQTDNGELQYEGELEVGLEVFVEQDGELIPAPDGEYKSEDKTITVESGRISSIVEAESEESAEEPVEVEQEEEPTEESETSETNDELEALKKENEELIAKIAELEAQLAEANEQLKMSVEKPAHLEVKDIKLSTNQKANKALKYFS